MTGMKEKNIEKGERMPTIIDRIKTIDKTICRHLDNVDGKTRGIISQDVIAHLIAFVEHIMLNLNQWMVVVKQQYMTIIKKYVFMEKMRKLY